MGATVALAVLVMGAALTVAHNLDHPSIKRRIQAKVAALSGVAIDYRAVRLRLLSGVDIDDIVVATPGPFAAFAPHLLRIGHVGVRWSTSLRRRPALREVSVERVAISVVIDEDGKSTFDAFPRSPDNEPPTPHSHLPAKLLGKGFPLQAIALGDVTLALVQVEKGVEVEHDTLRGLSLRVDAEPVAEGARLRLSLGQPHAPLAVGLERRRGDVTTSAEARLWAGAEVSPTEATASLDLKVERQDLWPEIQVEHLARLGAKAGFDTSAGSISLSLGQLEVGDGVASLEGSARLPDGALPVIDHARGDVDVGRLVRLAPRGHLPVRVGQGKLQVRIDELSLEHPTEATRLEATGEVTGVDLTHEGTSLSIGSAQIGLRARALGAAGLGAEATISLGPTHLTHGALELRGEGLTVRADGGRGVDGAISGKADLRFAALDIGAGTNTVAARDGELQLRTNDLRVDTASPLETRGDVTVESKLASLDARAAVKVRAHDVHLHAHTPLAGDRTFALDAEVGAGRLRVERPDGRPLSDAPTHADIKLRDVHPVLEHPARTRAVAHAEVRVGDVRASADATKEADALGYDVRLQAPRLTAVRALVPQGLAMTVPWEKMALALRSSGRVERFSGPTIKHHTEIRLQRPELGGFAARSLAVDIESSGTTRAHRARADVRLDGLVAQGVALGDDHLTASLVLDRDAPSASVVLVNEGAPKAEISASVSFDRAKRAVVYDVAGHVDHLSPLAPFASKVPALAGVDLSRLGLRVASKGNVLGVVSEVDQSGSPRLASDPLRSASGECSVDLRAAHVHWAKGDHAVSVPAASLRAVLRADGAKRMVEGDLEVGRAGLGLGHHHVDVEGIRSHMTASLTGDIAQGEVELSERLQIAAVKQSVAPMYQVGDLAVTLAARRSSEGLLRLDGLRVENHAAGTTLEVGGGFMVDGDRQRLSLRGALQQDLARASIRHDLFEGRGTVGLDFSIDSPNMLVFHTDATVRVNDASISLPARQVVLESIEGEVPLVADLTVGKSGVGFVRKNKRNAFTHLRFADQHPLVRRKSFFSIRKVTTPLVSIAPFVANLKVEHNVISLAQLEMGVRGGLVTGDLSLEYDGADSTVQAAVRASNLQSSHGEPFDGNAALLVSVRDHAIDGRADILRIGPRHLLDLLDLQDPQHTDAAMNKVRSSLSLGYPERVRLSFDHGFLGAEVSLGGLGSLVHLDELRGIATGPLMERVVSSVTNPQEAP